jgi:carboxypeptidase Q
MPTATTFFCRPASASAKKISLVMWKRISHRLYSALNLSLVIGCWFRAGAANDANDVISRIREEGFNRSQVMETLSHLTDVIGPRLTGSPNHMRANEWTRDKLASWGLTNAHLESVPFGRGWSLRRFSAQVIEPQGLPLVAYPNAWSPGLERPIASDAVFLDAQTTEDLEKYKGKLKDAIVLISPLREIEPPFTPMASRLDATNLLQLANAGDTRNEEGRKRSPARPRPKVASRTQTNSVADNSQLPVASTNRTEAAALPKADGPGRSGPRFLSFLAQEGAALIVHNSSMGHGGTVFVGSALLPPSKAEGTNRVGSVTNPPRVWSSNAPAILPQITMATEDYNRLVRMLRQQEKVKMAVEFEAQFHDHDLRTYNTIAEIPGADLRDEIVMLGAHLDSWHAGTGATDNGIGVATTMEAVRILRSLNLKPRRTIRIGLWTGEEQGFLGSKAYVTKHFGYWTNMPNARPVRAPKDQRTKKAAGKGTPRDPAPGRKLFRLDDYEKFSAYFNVDNGAGRICGIYLQGNEALRPQFREWLAPFKDLGADTISTSNTYGTDHIPFDRVGLPAFQFIQDWLDYGRTHHSSQDVYDRVIAEDAKQTAVILAAFAYQTAMLDVRLPRKPLEKYLGD